LTSVIVFTLIVMIVGNYLLRLDSTFVCSRSVQFAC